MKITVIPKYIFDDIIDGIYSDDKAFISIIDVDNNENRFTNYLSKSNFIQIKMNDVDSTNLEDLPSIELLLELIDFFYSNKNKDEFVIHCSLGVSRSGAVGRFIAENIYTSREEYTSFYNRNYRINPNLYILEKLKKAEYIHRCKNSFIENNINSNVINNFIYVCNKIDSFININVDSIYLSSYNTVIIDFNLGNNYLLIDIGETKIGYFHEIDNKTVSFNEEMVINDDSISTIYTILISMYDNYK